MQSEDDESEAWAVCWSDGFPPLSEVTTAGLPGFRKRGSAAYLAGAGWHDDQPFQQELPDD